MNWLDLLIVIVVAIGLIKGLFDGFIKQVVSLASFILAIFFAGKIAGPLRDWLVNYDSITNTVPPLIITIVCYMLAFVFIILIFKYLGKLLSNATAGPVSYFNHLFGGLFGAFLSLLLLSLTFNILTAVDSDSIILKEQTKQESVLFHKVESIVTLISPYIKEIHVF